MRSARTFWAGSVASAGQDSRETLSNNAWVRVHFNQRFLKIPFERCFNPFETDIDECARADTCGHGATCTNTEGSYSCTCPEGTIPDPDPYIKCVGIVTCEVDGDCPGNAICDPQKRCLCPEPNVGNDCRREHLTPSLLLLLQIQNKIKYSFILINFLDQIRARICRAGRMPTACCPTTWPRASAGAVTRGSLG